MDREKLGHIYDALSETDKKSVGMIGIYFIQHLCGNLTSILGRFLHEKNN